VRKQVNACLQCGGEAAAVYCSNRCQADRRWKLFKEEVERTSMVSPSVNGRPAKRYLIEKHGRVCSICQFSIWFGQEMPVTLDHIDGNADNWALDNLRLICPNCDTFTPTFKARNKGKGRHTRRQRYKEGKSY
jgi:5-methylcytosine-specific restriction endonuclease McrA